MKRGMALNPHVVFSAGLWCLAACLLCSGLLAQGTDGPKTAPAPGVASALDAKLILNLNNDIYILDPAQSGPEFVKKLQESKKDMGKTPPLPPAVDMTFELTNTGKDAVTIPLGADSTHLDIRLEGPCAVTIPYARMHTMEYRLGKSTRIEPGESLAIPIKRLLFGARNDSMACYWTEPGTYTLTVSYTAPFGDEPKGAMVFTAPPVPVKVVAAAAKADATPHGVTREQAVAAADALLKVRGLNWGKPEKMDKMSSGTWWLEYAPHQDILGRKHPCMIFVSPEGKARFTPYD